MPSLELVSVRADASALTELQVESEFVQPRQEIDLLDENEVVDWRGVCDDNHVQSPLKSELLSPGAGGAFPGLARNRQP